MKIYSVLLTLILLSSTAISNPDRLNPKEFQILCITEFPTTSFIGHSRGNEMALRFVNSNGIKFMPISSTLITSHDLTLLAARAEALKNLPEEIEFPIELKNCVIYADQTFYCHGGEAQFLDLTGQVVLVDHLYSNQSTTKSQNYTYDQVQISIGFRIKGESYTVSMNYTPSECGINYR
jgi:hypothetical protein